MNIDELLAEWQHYYNWERAHDAHKGKSPMERYFELSESTPFSDDVSKDYSLDSENIQNANYKQELALRKLK